MAKKHRPYAPEFRRQMIELVRAGRGPEELAKEFEPSAQAIRNWVAQADRDEGRRADGLTTAEREELNRLRREIRQLKLEREILETDADRLRLWCKTAVFILRRGGKRPSAFWWIKTPFSQHGPWVAAYLQMVTPNGDPD